MEAVRVHRYGGPDVLTLEKNIPIPAPGDGQVLIRVRASGLNPVETYVRSGTFEIKPDLPYVPGSDAAGEVAKVGPGVENFKIGDRVYTLYAEGSYAQYALAKAVDVDHLSDKLTYEQGAALGIPYLTVHRALFTKGFAKAGETVLIHGGTGGVGIAAIQMALGNNLRVFATGGTDEGLALMTKLGVHRTFNHRKQEYQKEILNATDGQGVDIILENLANVNLGADLKLLSRFGRVMVVGARGTVEIDPRLAIGLEADIRGILIFRATQDELVDSFKAVRDGIEAGYIRPVVGKHFTLEQAAEGHVDIINSKGALGKSVFTIEGTTADSAQ